MGTVLQPCGLDGLPGLLDGSSLSQDIAHQLLPYVVPPELLADFMARVSDAKSAYDSAEIIFICVGVLLLVGCMYWRHQMKEQPRRTQVVAMQKWSNEGKASRSQPAAGTQPEPTPEEQAQWREPAQRREPTHRREPEGFPAPLQSAPAEA